MTQDLLVARSTLFRRIFNFRNTLILLIIAFAILTTFAKAYPYFSFDLTITQTIQRFRPLWFEQLMIVLSIFGNVQWAIVSVLLVSTFIFLLDKKREAVMVIVSALGSLSISQFFKLLVARPRPDGTLVIQMDTYFKSNSFPSGHVMFYVGFYGFLVFLTFIFIKKKLLRNFMLATLSVPVILGGVSRVYLGVHWFSDVLGAYLIGFVWLLLVIHLYETQIRKKDN